MLQLGDSSSDNTVLSFSFPLSQVSVTNRISSCLHVMKSFISIGLLHTDLQFNNEHFRS